MSPLPAEFIGLWERVELVVEGAPVLDAGQSYWFQTEERFLDVRSGSPHVRPEAFAGTTRWDSPTQSLTWTHELDINEPAGVDSGRIEWSGGDLIEHGTADVGGQEIAYSERWRRREAGQSVAVTELPDGGRHASCGDVNALIQVSGECEVISAEFRLGRTGEETVMFLVRPEGHSNI